MRSSVIRLAGLNLSQTNIALSCNASKTTVNKVLKAASGDVTVTADMATDIEFYLIQNGYVDKKRKIAGEDRMLIPDGLLQCDTGVSGKEVIDTVTRVVEEVAEEHGANTAVALAKVKAAVAEKVEDDEELPPWDIVDEVFEDEPVIKESVRAALTEEKVPERVPVERKQVERAAVRNHKIRTDTGIEISFPAEMGSNSEYIEFVNEPNGLISIELKNIGSIENR